MPIDRFIEFAHECGADGIEILDAFLYEPGVVRDHLPDPQTIETVRSAAKAAMERTGMKVHAIAVTNDFNYDDNARLVVERGKIRLGLELARDFGASVVRVFSGNPSSSDAVDLVRYRTIDALKDLNDPQIALAIENHGNVFATPSRLDSILEPLESSNAGLCFDVGNFILADIDPVEAAHALPSPKLIHVKDFRPQDGGPYKSSKGQHYEGCRLGEGVVPIAETLQVLLSKLDGQMIPIDLEMECGPDGIEATRAGVAWLRQLLKSQIAD